MLTMENVTALRMRRHCLTRRAGAAEYDALYRDLSPGLTYTGTGSGSRRAWWSARILTTWNTTAGASGSAFW